METKTWAKRVAALTTGALMLGATLAGALAYDLGELPAPFVASGRISDTVIVVGEAAASSDVLGAVDIAAMLQAESKVAAGTGTSTEATADAGVKVDKSGEKFNYNDYVYNVTPETLDDTDLPDLLADAEYNDDEGDNTQDEDYTQELTFAEENFQFVFDTPEDGNAGSYLKVVDGGAVYTYTFEFDEGIAFDSAAIDDDFVGTKIEILGKVYTITDATASGDYVDELTLVSGDSTVWLQQDQPLDFGGDTITVVDVGNDGTKCGVDVNGHIEWITEGGSSDDFPSDLSVGVLEVVETASEGENACELSLGSAEIVFADDDAITMNGEEIEGSNVNITYDGTDSWLGFVVTYDLEQDDSNDDVYLAEGEAWTDPVFSTWKVEYAGITADYEDMDWSASGDGATFNFVNNDDMPVEIGWFWDGAQQGLGYGDNKPLLLPGEKASTHNLATDDPTDVSLLYVTSGGEAHVLEITSIDCEDATQDTIKIEDVTYGGEDVEDVTCPASGSAANTISLGIGELSLNLSSEEVIFNDVSGKGDGAIETLYEGGLVFNGTDVVFTEKAGDEADSGSVRFTMAYDDEDNTFDNTGVSFSSISPAPTAKDSIDGEDEEEQYMTIKGTHIVRDVDEESTTFTIKHPEEDAFANVFITPLDATISTVTSGGDAYMVNPFDVGLAVLDTDAESMTKNMIIVGGPCANTIASEVMGEPTNCVEGFEDGKAMLKFFDRNGKAALLVAGFSAQDTKGAAYVLADYNEYTLSGEEVEVVSTNLADLEVRVV